MGKTDMRAKFIRGQDPKDAMGIGLPHVRIRNEAERALTEIANEYGGSVQVEYPVFQGPGHVRITVYFLKGHELVKGKRPLEYGLRYKIEYEDGSEKPLTVNVSIGGNDWHGFYIDDVKQGQKMIWDWIDQKIETL